MKILHWVKNENIKNGILFSLFSFFNTGLNFVIMMVMARFIKPDSYGQLSLFTTMVTLLSIFVCFNTNGFVGVNFFSSTKKYIQRLLNVVLLTTLFVYMVMLTVISCFQSTFEQISGLTIVYQFYAITFCALNIVNVLLLDIWRLEENIWKYGVFSVLSVLCNLFFTIFLVGVLKWDWQGRMYAQLITCICFSAFALYILMKKRYLCKVLPEKKDFIDAYSFGVPLIPHSTSFWLRHGLDRYIINAFTTQTMVGLFSFASNFSNIIQIVGSAFNSSNSVYIYKILSDFDNSKMKQLKQNCHLLMSFYVFLTMLVFIGVYLFVPLIFPKYENCILYIFPLCIGAMFQCFYLVYVNIIFFYQKTKQLMYITFSLSLIHAILSFLFTRYGVVYTAYISMITNAVIACSVYYYSKKILEKKCRISD